MMEPFFLAMALAASTWLFWILFIPVTLLAIICVEDIGRNRPEPLLCIPAMAVIAYYVYPAYMENNWLHTLENIAIFLCSYAVIGALYSIARWYFHLLKWRDKTDIVELKQRYNTAINEFIKNVPGKSFEERREFNLTNLRWAIEQNIRYGNWPLAELPIVSKNKYRITTWITCWPWSILSWLIRDMVVDVAMWIYRKLGFVYDNIATAVLKNFIK